jgi:hypothetical protein
MIVLRCKGAGARKDHESGKQENRKLRDRDRVGCHSNNYFAGAGTPITLACAMITG